MSEQKPMSSADRARTILNESANSLVEGDKIAAADRAKILALLAIEENLERLNTTIKLAAEKIAGSSRR